MERKKADRQGISLMHSVFQPPSKKAMNTQKLLNNDTNVKQLTTTEKTNENT